MLVLMKARERAVATHGVQVLRGRPVITARCGRAEPKPPRCGVPAGLSLLWDSFQLRHG